MIDQGDELRMSFGEHLEDLRRRLILAIGGVVACCGVTLIFGQQILAWLCVPLMVAQRSVGVPAQAYAMSPLSGFAIYLKGEPGLGGGPGGALDLLPPVAVYRVGVVSTRAAGRAAAGTV